MYYLIFHLSLAADGFVFVDTVGPPHLVCIRIKSCFCSRHAFTCLLSGQSRDVGLRCKGDLLTHISVSYLQELPFKPRKPCKNTYRDSLFGWTLKVTMTWVRVVPQLSWPFLPVESHSRAVAVINGCINILHLTPQPMINGIWILLLQLRNGSGTIWGDFKYQPRQSCSLL